jgi:O-antigen ligase
MKSVILAEPGSPDYSSNMYRVAESINLRRTIAQHPLGLGFGHPFELHVPLPDISALLPNWRYHPHDMILGIWLSLGTICFTVFLIFVGGIMMSASYNLRRFEDNYIRAICFFVLASFSSGFLVAAVDQFIWSERGAIFLGAVVGILSAVTALLSSVSAAESCSRAVGPSGGTDPQPSARRAPI